jgi:CDP-glucose 4,6-dehydratase
MAHQVDPHFWSGKNIFLTGHTGFKGGWLAVWLSSMGAKVTGYSLPPNTEPNLYSAAKIKSICERSNFGDIRNLEQLKFALAQSNPEVVIHMAAQPLVRYSYDNPVETYSTNVMGTVHVLEAVRACESVKAVIVVTSDKCYENKGWLWGYRETDSIGGYDPYSNSKGCTELVVSAYCQSFFPEHAFLSHGVGIATGRAGNVIGGGDWSSDRLIPDAIKAFRANKPLMIRNPKAVRPWQHVLEPLSGYLVLAQSLYEHGASFNGGWNFGPRDVDMRSVREVIDLLIKQWGHSAAWLQDGQEQPHEAHLLKLDCTKARQLLGWKSVWSLEESVKSTLNWHHAFWSEEDMLETSLSQIQSYLEH